MVTIIFDELVDGHHIEYLHHLYEGARRDKCNRYIFVVSTELYHKGAKGWQSAENIDFDYLSDKEEKDCKSGGIYLSAFKRARIIGKKTKLHNAERLFLVRIMSIVPFIFLFVNSKLRIRGIVYQIYLYRLQSLGKLKLLLEKIRYYCLAKSRVIDKVFILNDENSKDKFNHIYKTNKFYMLPDPVLNVNVNECRNVRDELHIPHENTVYLHFGAMDARKGTLEILQAISECDKSLNNVTFIFAGRVCPDIRNDFYQLVHVAKENARILVYDEFCSYEFLYNLCYSSDILLVPYTMPFASSGVIGYASIFHKPVIGPENGLLGLLIKRYNLGYTIKEITSSKIKDCFGIDIKYQNNSYVKEHTIDSFINVYYK